MFTRYFLGALTLLKINEYQAESRIRSPLKNLLVHLFIVCLGLWIFNTSDLCCVISDLLTNWGVIVPGGHGHLNKNIDFLDYLYALTQLSTYAIIYFLVEPGLKKTCCNVGDTSETWATYHVESLCSTLCLLVLFYMGSLTRVSLFSKLCVLIFCLLHLLILVNWSLRGSLNSDLNSSPYFYFFIALKILKSGLNLLMAYRTRDPVLFFVKFLFYHQCEQFFEFGGSLYNYLFFKQDYQLDLKVLYEVPWYLILHFFEHAIPLILVNDIVNYTLFYGFTFFIHVFLKSTFFKSLTGQVPEHEHY